MVGIKIKFCIALVENPHEKLLLIIINQMSHAGSPSEDEVHFSVKFIVIGILA